MKDMLGNPIWPNDTVAYVRRGPGERGNSALMLGTVQVLKDPRWGDMYVRVTDLKDASQCLRAGPQVAVCREPPHGVKPPWPGADLP